MAKMTINTKHFMLLAGLLVNLCWPLNAEPTKLKWHGFIAQGAMQAEDNSFINDDGDLSFKLTDIGLNASYQINRKLRVAGQAVYLNADNRYQEGARIDYLLLDWTLFDEGSSNSNLLLGRFKNSHWLYSATRDVPHSRPSIILPQSVYFDALRDAGLTIQGAGLRANHLIDSGNLTFELNYGSGLSLRSGTAQHALSRRARGEMDVDSSLSASLRFSPLSERWLTYISYVDVDFDYDASGNESLLDADATLERTMLGFLYSGERYELASELFEETSGLDGFLASSYSSETTSQGGYLQLRYFINPKLTGLLRVDTFDRDKDDRDGSKLERSTFGMVPDHFGYMDDLTLGLQWTFKRNLSLQMEYHNIRGTGRSGPVVEPNLALNQKSNWDMWALQLMYWF